MSKAFKRNFQSTFINDSKMFVLCWKIELKNKHNNRIKLMWFNVGSSVLREYGENDRHSSSANSRRDKLSLLYKCTSAVLTFSLFKYLWSRIICSLEPEHMWKRKHKGNSRKMRKGRQFTAIWNFWNPIVDADESRKYKNRAMLALLPGFKILKRRKKPNLKCRWWIRLRVKQEVINICFWKYWKGKPLKKIRFCLSRFLYHTFFQFATV